MFKTNGTNIARNENGVEIKIYARDFVEYSHRNRVLHIPSEINLDEDLMPLGRTLYLGSHLNWEPPFTNEPISSSELEEIRLNLIEASDAFVNPFKFA